MIITYIGMGTSNISKQRNIQKLPINPTMPKPPLEYRHKNNLKLNNIKNLRFDIIKIEEIKDIVPLNQKRIEEISSWDFTIEL